MERQGGPGRCCRIDGSLIADDLVNGYFSVRRRIRHGCAPRALDYLGFDGDELLGKTDILEELQEAQAYRK